MNLESWISNAGKLPAVTVTRLRNYSNGRNAGFTRSALQYTVGETEVLEEAFAFHQVYVHSYVNVPDIRDPYLKNKCPYTDQIMKIFRKLKTGTTISC